MPAEHFHLLGDASIHLRGVGGRSSLNDISIESSTTFIRRNRKIIMMNKGFKNDDH